MMVNLKVERIHKFAKVPTYAYPGDSGFDLFSIERKTVPAGKPAIIRTGLCIELPREIEAQIRPKSGLALKHSITVLNSPGTIDSSYRGELLVIIINHGKRPYSVKVGEAVAQLVLQRIVRARIKLSVVGRKTVRGEKGFGSSGV